MLKLAAAFAALICSVSAQAGGDIKAGQQKAAMCVACHGPTGHASSPLYPSLAGQNAEYLVHSLQAYKNGERKGAQAAIMKAYVAGLSDEDIANLAAFYASQKPEK